MNQNPNMKNEGEMKLEIKLETTSNSITEMENMADEFIEGKPEIVINSDDSLVNDDSLQNP